MTRPKPSKPSKSRPTVTIQIPTYNELAALECAKRCLALDYPKNKIQIIIGDDSNNKAISRKIDAFAKQHNILVTRRGLNVGYKPGNLNHMLKYSTGEIIVIFDSDFLPEPDFLKRIVAPFDDKRVAVAQARWKIANFRQNIVSVLGGTISLNCHQVALSFISRTGANTFLCGSAEAIRRQDIEKLGGWQAGSLTEDIECSLRLQRRNRRIVYLEDLECACEAPQTIKDLCKQQMRWAFGVISALKLHLVPLSKSKVKAKDKCSSLILASGYMFTMMLFGLTLLGTLSLITDRPASINWALFMTETVRNILLTSGFLVSSILSLWLGGETRSIPRMLLSSLTVGLIITIYVNVGIIKAALGRRMQWFMLKKNGNSIRSTPRPAST